MVPPTKTHCKNGHLRVPENLLGSNCRICLATWRTENVGKNRRLREPELRKAAPVTNHAKPEELARMKEIAMRRMAIKRESLALADELNRIMKRFYQRAKRIITKDDSSA